LRDRAGDAGEHAALGAGEHAALGAGEHAALGAGGYSAGACELRIARNSALLPERISGL
jgi:hypothetical protein